MTAAKIRALRARLSLSQADFAREVGVSRVTVIRWETGEQPPRLAQVRRLKALEAGESPAGAAVDDALLLKSLPKPERRAQLREGAGFTVKALAGTLKVSPSSLSKWERGVNTPHGHELAAYAAVLKRLEAAA